VHIGFLSTEFPSPKRPGGGLANYLANVTTALHKQGHRSTVFLLCSEAEEGEGEETQTTVRLRKIRRFTFPALLRKLPGFVVLEYWFNSRRLAKEVLYLHQKDHIDLVQSPNIEALGLALSVSEQIPVICRCSCYSPLFRDAWGEAPSLHYALSDWLEHRLYLKATNVFTPSTFMATHLASAVGRNVEVIRSPCFPPVLDLDYSLFESQLCAKHYLLYVGTLNRVKGSDVFTDAIPRLAEQNPNLHFVLIGRDDHYPGRKSAIDYLREKTAEYSHRVHCFSELTKRELYPIIQHARALVIPSRVDNYPNVCLEALAMRVPVIAARGASLEEMLVEDETGIFFENGNPSALAEAAESFLSLSSAIRSDWQENARQHLERLKKRNAISLHLDLYKTTSEHGQHA